MPRTKQPRKSRSVREAMEESESLMRDFERQAAQRIHKYEADYRMQTNAIANCVDVAQSGLPTDLRKLMFGELLALNATYEQDNVDHDAPTGTTNESSKISSVSKTAGRIKRKAKRATAASDDGYATESTTTRTTHVSRINSTQNSDNHSSRKHRSASNSTKTQNRPARTTRSSSRNSRKDSHMEQENKTDNLRIPGRCPSAAKYKTPSLKNNAPCFSAVTPKIKPNTAMNILRRPRQGEMVLSMQGSPLLISSIVQEYTANINVPLHNGNVISLLPNAGLRLSTVPALDDEVMKQLKTLKGHINTVIGDN